MTGRAPAPRIGRLAVVDPTGNAGGGMRFVRALLPALQRVRPELRTRFHANAASIAREGVADELASAGIEVVELEWLLDKPWKSRPLRKRVAYKVRRRIARGVPGPEAVIEAERETDRIREMEAIDGDADVVYFPWPYRMPVPSLRSAAVTTVHDVNYKYFFGVRNFSSEDVELLEHQIADWLQATYAVTSSQFMADEIARFYPSAPAVPVVRLAPFAVSPPERSRAEATVAALGLEHPYILCPTNVSVHKNLGPLIAAHARLVERFPNVKLVMAGHLTEAATGRATSIGTMRDGSSPDVIGLGYVSNTQIDSLIECATLVVNPSLYEAGNGPGLDAMSLGTPVAMSDIPSFREHLFALGVEAALFDPRDPIDIAAKLGEILEDPATWEERARRSRAALDAFTWDRVALAYLDVFDAAYAGSGRG